MGRYGIHGVSYHDVAAEIRTAVDGGDLPPGCQLPSETDLAKRFGCGRDTVRDALADLAQEGIVIKQRGKRTIVRERPTRTPVPLPAGATIVARPVTRHEIEDLGWPPGTAVIEVHTAASNPICYPGDRYVLAAAVGAP